MFCNVWFISTCFDIPDMFCLTGFKQYSPFFNTFILLLFLLCLSRLFMYVFCHFEFHVLSVEGCRSTAESSCFILNFFAQQKLLLFLSVLKNFQLFCVAWLSNLFRYTENNVINCVEVKGGVWSSHCIVKWSDTQLPKTCRRNMGRLRQKIRFKALIAWSFLGNLNIFVNFQNIIKRSDSPNIPISCCSVRRVLQKLIWSPWRGVFLMNNN